MFANLVLVTRRLETCVCFYVLVKLGCLLELVKWPCFITILEGPVAQPFPPP